jgi:hypothetical protein
MMRKNTLIKLSHSGKINHITVEELGTDRVIHCASLYVSKRGIVYFNDENRKALLSFGIGNVVIILRMDNEPVKDNEYIFLFELKDCTAYKIRIFMQEGYTPFLTNKNDIANFKAVYEAIPKKLDELKGKAVRVKQTSDSEMFNSYIAESDNEAQSITGLFFIERFDYTVEMRENVPVVKFFDSQNLNISCTALKVAMITKISDDTIIISADNCDFYLAENID